MFKTVVIKLIAPRMEEIPARWSEKIAKSTAGLLCPTRDLSGGYIVQPVPTPPSTKDEKSKRINAGGNNQNLKLLRRGKAMSVAPTNSGNIQLPKPPIRTGITKKKIIIKACAVTRTLYR